MFRYDVNVEYTHQKYNNCSFIFSEEMSSNFEFEPILLEIICFKDIYVSLGVISYEVKMSAKCRPQTTKYVISMFSKLTYISKFQLSKLT